MRHNVRKLILVFLFVFICVTQKATSQPVNPPQFQSTPYDPSQLQNTFNIADKMDNIQNWDNFVLQSTGLLRAEWENAANAEILAAISAITTQDSFNSVQAYKDYVQNSLQSQAQTAYAMWEVEASQAILAERENYVALKYGTNYSDAQASEATFETQLQNLNSDSIASQQSQTVGYIQSEWNAEYNGNLQDGLNQYQQSLNAMTQNYQQLLNSLNTTDAQYQQNLAQIEGYKQQVINGIQSSMSQMQDYLNGEDLFWGKDANGNKILNSDGIAFQGFLDQINKDIQNNSSLPTIAQDFINFLQQEQTLGQANVSYYDGISYRHQYSLGGYATSVDSMNPTGDKTAYGIQQYYRVGGFDLIGYLNDNNLTGAAGYTVYAIDSANLTAYNSTGQYCHGIIGCGNALIGDSGIYNANRSVSQDPSNFYYYDEYQLVCGKAGSILCGWNHVVSKEDSVSVSLVVEEKSQAAIDSANSWKNLTTQMTKFLGEWQNNVLPAITNWEAQVNQYQTQYDQFQVEKQGAIANASSKYQDGIKQLQSQEADWLYKMGQLKSQADSKFLQVTNSLSQPANGDSGSGNNEVFSGLLGSLPGVGVSGDFGNIVAASLATITSNLSSNPLNNAVTNLPDLDNLDVFHSGVQKAIVGLKNFSLLSATNNSLLNARMSMIQEMADSYKEQRSFTDNGLQDLLSLKGFTTKTVGSETYLLNAKGEQKGTLSDFINNTCGKSLDSPQCSEYTTNTYRNVTVNSDGSISLTTAMHTGHASVRSGGDATNANDYNYETKDQVITIAAPAPIAFGMNDPLKGLSPVGDSVAKRALVSGTQDTLDSNVVSLDDPYLKKSQVMMKQREETPGIDLFDDDSVYSLVNQAFQNENDYFSSDNLKRIQNSQMAMLEKKSEEDNLNKGAAQEDAIAKANVANLEVSLVQTFLGGGGIKQWVDGQVHQAVQSTIATALVNTFNLSPDVASFLSGGLMDQQQASRAQKNIARATGGIGLLTGLTANNPLMKAVLSVSNPKDMAAVQKYKEDKYQLQGLMVQKFGESQGWPPEVSQRVGQYATDRARSDAAKTELGMKGSMLSMGRLEGVVNNVVGTVGGWATEVAGAFIKANANVLERTGAMSHDQAKEINSDFRNAINTVKQKDAKEAISAWKADQIDSYGLVVEQYGKQQGWSEDQIQGWVKEVEGYASRRQAQAEIKNREMSMAVLNPAFLVDQKLLGGGILSMGMKLVKGITTTYADLGRGMGLLSKADTTDIYHQSKDIYNDVTMTTLKAEAHAVRPSQLIQQQTRDNVFNMIGQILGPQFPGLDASQIGQVLKYYEDQQQAKRDAKNQKMEEAGQVVAIAAAAVATYFTAGAAGGTLVALMESVPAMTAVGTNIAVQTYIGSQTGGTNGAIAGFANGVISAATMGEDQLVTGYVSWTPHQNANIITGQQEQKGGWGGGVSVAMGPTEDYGRYSGMAGLSYAPGSGTSINMNVNLPNKAGMPKGMYGGFSYNISNNDYSVNGGFSLKSIKGKNGSNNFGLSFSADNNGQSSLGINYGYSSNKGSGGEATRRFNQFMGANLSYSNTGDLTLSHQMRGTGTLSMSYNTDTHTASSLTVNRDFQNAFNQALIQHNASEGAAKAEEKRTSLYGKVLVEMGVVTNEEFQAMMSDESGAGQETLRDLYAKIHESATSSAIVKAALESAQDSVIQKYNQENGERSLTSNNTSPEGTESFFTRLGNAFNESRGIMDNQFIGPNENGEMAFRNCFVAGTKVKTIDGLKNIEDIKSGDLVASANQYTGVVSFKPVKETYIRKAPRIYKLTYNNGTQVETTGDHPFYIEGKGWTKADEVFTGDVSPTWKTLENRGGIERREVVQSRALGVPLLNAGEDKLLSDLEGLAIKDPNSLEIVKIEVENQETTVYNFQVEDDHTYFVTESEIWVHNATNYSVGTGEGKQAFLDRINKDLQSKGKDPITMDELMKLTVTGCEGTECSTGLTLGKQLEKGWLEKGQVVSINTENSLWDSIPGKEYIKPVLEGIGVVGQVFDLPVAILDRLGKILLDPAKSGNNEKSLNGVTINSDIPEKLGKALNQYQGNQELRKTLESVRDSDSRFSELDASDFIQNSCVASAAFIDMKFANIDVGDYQNYLKVSIGKGIGMNAYSNVTEIANNFKAKNNTSYEYDGDSKNLVNPKDTGIFETQFNKIKEVLESGSSDHYMLRLGSRGSGHTVGLIQKADGWYIIDVGNGDSNGKKLDFDSEYDKSYLYDKWKNLVPSILTYTSKE